MSGIKTETAASVNQILFMTQPYAGVGVVVANTGLSPDSNGKKILKAGTPMYGNLQARATSPYFVKATTTQGTSNAVGVLAHDVDVTGGNENATLIIHGFIDVNKLDTTTQGLITAEVINALKGNVTFLK